MFKVSLSAWLKRVLRLHGAFGGQVTKAGALGAARFQVQELSNFGAVRPALPPLFVCGVFLWISCALCFSQAWRLEAGECAVGAFAAAVASICAAVLLVRSASRSLVCALLGACLGLLFAFGGAFAQCRAMEQLADWKKAPAAELVFQLKQDGALGQTSFSKGYAALAQVARNGVKGPCVRVVVQGSEQVPLYGQQVSGRVSWGRLDLGTDYGRSLWCQGAVGVAYVTGRYGSGEGTGSAASPKGRDGIAKATAATAGFNVLGMAQQGVLQLRSAAIERMEEHGTGEAMGVLQALVCGYRANLRGTNAYQDFQTAGLAHLVAVSGAHLAIVCTMLVSVLRTMGAPRGLSIALQLAFMAAYVLFAGAPVSALRAAVMCGLGLLSLVPKRQASSLSALGACVMVFLALDPATSTSLSFMLSAGATAGIALFAQLFQGWIMDWAPGMRRSVQQGLAATMAANVLSLGLSAAQFSTLPLVSPLANLLVSPLLGAVCCAGLVGVVLAVAVPGLAPVAVGLPAAGCQAMVWLAHALANLPFACIPVQVNFGVALFASLAGAFALWAAWPKVSVCLAGGLSLGFICIAVCFGLLGAGIAGTQIIALDVGQGDAILLRSGGKTVLVDTGNQDQKLRQALARHGVYSLDAVLITHADDDHCGSLEALGGVAQVKQVCVAAGALTCPCSKCQGLVESAAKVADGGLAGVVGLKQGSLLSMGAMQLKVVWPRDFTDEGGNADSLCVVAQADVDHDGNTDQTALLCGDAESDQLQEMLDQGLVGDLDLYKVGHHGSKASITPQQAVRLSPLVALVSAGAGNRYGHPSQECLDALQAAQAQVFRTDQLGDVVCTLQVGGIRVRTQR